VYFEARPGKQLPLGISVGTAVFPQDGESYEALLATADSRMYQDKAGRKRRNGRDADREQVLVSSPFPELSDIDVQQAAAGIL
jgi:GGDEF domain-containing protein